MIKYKIDMKVWIDSEKFIITDIGIHPIDSYNWAIYAKSLTEDGYSCVFFSDDDQIKPIIRC